MTKGTVLDCRKEKAGAPITARSPANEDRVRASVQQSPKKSLRHMSQELGISVTSLQRMLRKDLNNFPYKISTCHKLTDTDKQRRTEMCNKRMDRFQNWIDKVWFTDEAHFHLNGAVSHHNNVYWGDERPEEIDEKYLKGPKVTALCALNAKKGMLGPYWFEDSRGRTVTVNGERYREVLNRINEDLNQLYTPNQKRLLWFQQVVQLPIQYMRLWPICAHCLETEFGVCRQSSNDLRIVLILHLLTSSFGVLLKQKCTKRSLALLDS